MPLQHQYQHPTNPLVSRVRVPRANQQMEEEDRCVTVRTFWCNSTPNKWECEFGSGPNEAKITRKLKAGYAYAGSVPVHSSNGDLPTTNLKDGKSHLSSGIPETEK